MQTKNPIAVLISDLHLSLSRPACRNDDNWLSLQASYLSQVKTLAKTGLPTEIPVVCSGDIFDRWNTPPELIRFALQHLPDEMMSVPGQHDLPNHMQSQKHRSGYGVLAQVGKIVDLTEHDFVIPKKHKFVAFGFGWEDEIKPKKEMGFDHNDEIPTLAVIHRYCWVKEKKFPGAPEAAHISKYKKAIHGYNAAVFGDNHKPFIGKIGDCSILNVGTFIRRKSDEIDQPTYAGLLYSDGTIKRHALDTKHDKFVENAKSIKEETPFDLQAFIEGLEGLGEHGLNFEDAVINHLKKEELPEETKKLILSAIQNDK